MPLFDMTCEDCLQPFEFLKIKTDDIPICPHCGSVMVKKVFGNTFQVRMDPDTILKSLPDPSPPLEELRGKNQPGCQGGYADKPHADDQLKNYTRTRDKLGNSYWQEKRRKYYHG